MTGETTDGRPVTDEQIQHWADEAEAGYNTTDLRKRGRPTRGEGPSDVVPVRMDEALLTALTIRAEQKHVTRSEAIRQAVRAWTASA